MAMRQATGDDDADIPLLTPQEIADRSAEVRAGWPPKIARLRLRPDWRVVRWSVPVVSGPEVEPVLSE